MVAEGPEGSANDALSSPQTGRKVCAGCGVVNEASSAYCYRCGLRLPGEVTTGEPPRIPAGFWVRFGAWIIDRVFLGIVGTVALLAFWSASAVDLLQQSLMPDWRQYLITFVLEAAYWTFTIGRWGKSIGKALLQLKVVRADGSRVSYTLSFARYLAVLLSWLTLGIVFLMIALHPQKRGLHDLICDTRVVRDRQ